MEEGLQKRRGGPEEVRPNQGVNQDAERRCGVVEVPVQAQEIEEPQCQPAIIHVLDQNLLHVVGLQPAGNEAIVEADIPVLLPSNDVVEDRNEARVVFVIILGDEFAGGA